MKLAIIGSRGFSDYDLLSRTIEFYFRDGEINEIVSGGAAGADSLAGRWAREFQVKLTEFLPDWNKHGKSAGFIRNMDIVKYADMVLAFWNGQSKGTQNSLSIAQRLKKRTLIIYF